MSAKEKKECERSCNDKDMQKYFDLHQSDVPAGCRACGGPYPSCCDSCELFDE